MVVRLLGVICLMKMSGRIGYILFIILLFQCYLILHLILVFAHNYFNLVRDLYYVYRWYSWLACPALSFSICLFEP